MDQKKVFRAGGYSAILIVLVLAIVVVLNLIVSELPSTWTKYDQTSQSLFTFSQQTEELVKGLDKEVTITLIAQTGYEDTTILEMLERYAALNGKISVGTKDPVLYPYFTSQYTSDQVYNNSVVVECGDRYRFIGYYDIYQYTYNDDYSTSSVFAGESAVTGAISYVTSDTLPKVYLLTGHGESDLPEYLSESIEQNSIELDTLSLLTVEAIPDEVECLIVNAPTSDLTADEASMLGSYLRNGGRMLLLTNYSETEIPNLMSVMEGFGVTESKGLIIEGNAAYCLQGYSHYLLPEIVSHTITQPLLEGSYYIMTPLAHGIVETGEASEDITISSLLVTSDQSYLKPAGYDMETMEKEDGDVDGPFNVGVAITEEDDDDTTKIVWLSTNLVLDESVNTMVYGSNEDLILNSLSWMVDQEDGITIHAKSLSFDYLTMSSFDAGMWSVLLVFLLPVAILISGGVIWYRRKKR